MKNLTLIVDNVKRLPLTMDAMILALHRFTRVTAQDTQWVDGLNNLIRAMSGHVGNSGLYRYLAANTQHVDTLYRFALDNEWALETDAEFWFTTLCVNLAAY